MMSAGLSSSQKLNSLTSAPAAAGPQARSRLPCGSGDYDRDCVGSRNFVVACSAGSIKQTTWQALPKRLRLCDDQLTCQDAGSVSLRALRQVAEDSWLRLQLQQLCPSDKSRAPHAVVACTHAMHSACAACKVAEGHKRGT